MFDILDFAQDILGKEINPFQADGTTDVHAASILKPYPKLVD